MTRESRRAKSERGSALLIVFVFAAFVAIMLYREMPVAVFEAQRQKEQILIDRGGQYKRGVKLFYKKFGMYPASIEQLENTNRLRFLRRRLKDPFTGKDDWRLLHMGPGGMLVDSKVNPLKTNGQPGSALAAGTNLASSGNSSSLASSGFGSDSGSAANSGFGGSSRATASTGFGSNTSTFGNSGFGGSSRATTSTGFGSNTSTAASSGFSSFNNSFSPTLDANSAPASDPGAVTVQPVPKRPPAIGANGRTVMPSPGGTPNSGNTPGADQNGLSQPEQSGLATQPGDNSQSGQAAEAGQVAQTNAGATAGQTGQLQTQNTGTLGLDQTAQAAGAQGANSVNGIRHMLSNPSALGQTSNSSTFRIMSGGLAGVASKAQGHTIKVVNDQVQYSLWEFYYDPTKDVKQALPGGTGFGGAGASGITPKPVVNAANPPAPTSPQQETIAPIDQTGYDPRTGTMNPDNPPPSDEPGNPNDTGNPSDTGNPPDVSNPNDAPSEPPQ